MGKKTYTITAFNYRIGMDAVINYYPLTSKRQALDIASRMVATGAKNVKVTCDQSMETIFEQSDK